MADLFKKYAKNRTFKNLALKHIAHMYSKVFTNTEFPSKHLLIASLQILCETNHVLKKSRADQVIKKRQSVPDFKDLSVLQIMQKAQAEEFGLDIPTYEPRDIILLEMEAIFNYSRNYERNVQLFNDLCKLTSDSMILGHALFLFELDQHNKIDEKCLTRIETELKKLQPKTMISEMVLGLIMMRKYTNIYNGDREAMKEIKFFHNASKKEETNDNFELLQIKSEQTLIKFLEKALTHIQMALNIASRDKYKALEELYSCVKIRRTLDTLAIHFEQRGLHSRAMDAQYLSYTIAKTRQDDLGLIISLAHFTENLEQFKKLSKYDPSVPKMTQDLADLLQIFEKDRKSMPLYKQGYLYSAYLSLVSYYLTQDSCSKATEILKFLHEPLYTCEDKKYEAYFQTLRFKFYVIHLQLLLKQQPLSNISPIAFTCNLLTELNGLVEFRDEFYAYMPNLLFKLIEYLTWQQSARYDSKMLEPYVILVFKIAARKRMHIRSLQIYLSLAYIDLIGENLNVVEVGLVLKISIDLIITYVKFSDPSLTHGPNARI